MVIDAITEIQGGRRGSREEDRKREKEKSPKDNSCLERI